MFYQLMRFLLKQALRVYYRRVYVSGLENIPKNSPVIYASNHPNSFQDAVVIGINVSRPMTTLVRSDVFKSKFARWALGLWKLVPVYRIQEGSENLKKNDRTFEICKEILGNKGTVLIFSEGICITEKRLRPLKKGTARIALSASEEISDLYIVPVGVNYTYLTDFHNDLMINFGKPIKVSDYLNEYRESSARAINQLTSDISKSMAEELVIIENKANEEITEVVLKIARSYRVDSLFPWKRLDRSRFEMEKKIAENVTVLNKQNPNTFLELNKKTKVYSAFLEKSNLDDDYFIKSNNYGIFRYFFLVLFFPLYLLGSVLNSVPFILGKMVADKKVTVIEFYASVRLGAGYIVYVLFYISILTYAVCTQNIRVLILCLFVPFISVIAVNYKTALKEVITDLRYQLYRRNNKIEHEKIVTLRTEIINAINKAKMFD